MGDISVSGESGKKSVFFLLGPGDPHAITIRTVD